jgi:hypothetical protein
MMRFERLGSGMILRQMVAVAMAASMVAMTATGCSSSWPKVKSVSDASFNAWAPPSTIDVLPVDLEVWTHPGLKANPDEVRVKAESSIVGAATELLFQRGYAVGAVLDWQGQFVGSGGQITQAYAPVQLLDTVDALSSYGTAMEVTPREMPPPYLPVRLGQQTGSEATLYIGGWGFAGKSDSTGNAVLKGVLLGVAIIGVIAIVAVLAKSDSGGKLLDGVGKTAGTAAKAAASAGRVALRAAAQAGNVVIEAARIGAELSADVHVSAGPAVYPGQLVSAGPAGSDVFGRDETHLNLVSGRPEWSSAPDAKRSGGSAMYLEMTLVDNRTGLVRWHAHQRFPANPRNPGNIARAVKAMLASMPGSTPGAAPGR